MLVDICCGLVAASGEAQRLAVIVDADTLCDRLEIVVVASKGVSGSLRILLQHERSV